MSLPNFTFTTYTPAEKENPYREIVADLAAQTDEVISRASAAGQDTKKIEVPVVTFSADVNEAKSIQFKIQRAANEIGKTARFLKPDRSGVSVIGKDADGNDVHAGEVVMTFRMNRIHNARHGQPKSPRPNDDANDQDTDSTHIAEENGEDSSSENQDDSATIEGTEAPKPRRR